MSSSPAPLPPGPDTGPATGTGSPSQNLDAVIARLRAAGCVFAEDEAALLAAATSSPAELERLVARRVTGVPLEYVVGWAEFAGQRFVVDENVFVPRHRTEFLVDLAVDLAVDPGVGRAADLATGPAVGPAARRRPGGGRDLLVVDLCCGSGALGAIVTTRLRAVAVPELVVELHAADLDPAAVRCARRNLERLGGSVYTGDLYAALPPELRGQVDILLANAPYVPTSAIELLPPEFREHEARLALDGGADGLAVIRRVLAEAADWLAPGGHLLVETSAAQASALLASGTRGLTCRAVTAAGNETADGETADDETSADDDTTVVIATRPDC